MTSRFPTNVSNVLPILAAKRPRRANISFTPRPKLGRFSANLYNWQLHLLHQTYTQKALLCCRGNSSSVIAQHCYVFVTFLIFFWLYELNILVQNLGWGEDLVSRRIRKAETEGHKSLVKTVSSWRRDGLNRRLNLRVNENVIWKLLPKKNILKARPFQLISSKKRFLKLISDKTLFLQLISAKNMSL